MSSSTPSKEKRAERHLMRIRGAGKIARDISNDLFAFSIAVGAAPKSPQHEKVSPSKRRKLNNNDHVGVDVQRAACQARQPAESIGPQEVSEAPAIKSVSRARARQAGQKLFDEVVSCRRETKKTTSLTTTEDENTSTKLSAIGKADTAMVAITGRANKVNTDVKTTATHMSVSEVPIKKDHDIVKDACSRSLSDTPPPTAPIKHREEASMSKTKSSRLTTKEQMQNRCEAQKPASRTQRQLVTKSEHKKTKAISGRAVKLPCKRTISSSGDDDMESLPSSRSSLKLAKKAVLQPRQALASISTNRGSLSPAKRPSRHPDNEDPAPSVSKFEKRTKVRETTSSGSSFHAQPCSEHSKSMPSHDRSKKTKASRPSMTITHAQNTSRKRFRDMAEEDVDLDDLIMNIATLTRGIENHLPQQSISSKSKRQKLR